FAQKVQFGIMVEIPSIALIADRVAPSIDFFSIGTNDLTQYTLAADRTNARVAHLASPFHPAVLGLIQMTIRAAHAHKKWVGLCGELAGEVMAVPLLLGLGLDEFSLAPSLVPSIKRAIRKCVQTDCKIIAERALACSSISEVTGMLIAEAERLDLF
ncbi:MAG: phosphoenolpyruvate--protein phosphotransferase, partial [Peptococcaceae bacterium]|nr:phosphoenolpyruvate--protein phosphotransferase [Peptococcaceae bacterium]